MLLFNIDSINIKTYTLDKSIIQDFIEENNLTKFYNKNKNNKYGKSIVKKDNTILFQYYSQSNKFNSLLSYTMLEVHGLKKYSSKDITKKEFLLKLLVHLKKNNIEYDIQKLDYSIDIENQKLENIFLYKNSKRNSFNNILNHDIKTPFILENSIAYNTNRNNRLIAYDKSLKEDLEEEILRIEINLYPNIFRQIRKKDNIENLLIDIKKALEIYEIYIIKEEELRNKIVLFHKESNYKTNKRVRAKILKMLDEVDYKKIEFDYSSIEELLCYF